MKRVLVVIFTLLLLAGASSAEAQCSICTKTAQQMGERPAKALNSGIVYLAATPLALFAIIGIRWYRANKDILS
ncbi:hypothetical protein ACFSQD_10870 [Flavihumibacter stibioxidans]|uniref:Uncharacterized protein n=1 Tax=Flavihumibacter stibioxidans TaxID=1834163 RepID=A0ABR7MAB0_9BACT|nr:hypothetical protein [Flavihumibacter stibioxidans]MBC6491876.1 hypothetical protein [Flavihumibacter stibioxidans]